MTTKNNILKRFKDSAVGIIPKEWEVIKLEDIGIFSKGNGVPKDKITSQGYPCLTYGDLYTKYDFIIKNITSFINEDISKISKQINAGDICFAGSGETPQDIGKCATYLENHPAYAGGDIIILTPNNKVTNSLYVSYVINSHIGNKQRYKFAQGFSIVHIYTNNLKQIQIPLPPLNEQQKIVHILSLYDEAIEKQSKLIEKLELRKRGIMQRLLTGRTRLPGFTTPWQKVSYSEILKEIKRNIIWNDNEEYDLISVKRRSGGLFHRDKLLGKDIKTKNLRPANIGDFLISKMQIVHGASGLVTKEFDGMKISGSYIALVAKDKNKTDINFINWYSKTPHFYHQTYVSSYGVHIEKMTFDLNSFMSMNMKIPSFIEQKAIVNLLNTIDKEINIQIKKLETLRTQKRGLMQQLLTGKTRVKI